jgi:hypothetical protein
MCLPVFWGGETYRPNFQGGGNTFLRNIATTYKTPLPHKPEDDSPHFHCIENLKYYACVKLEGNPTPVF